MRVVRFFVAVIIALIGVTGASAADAQEWSVERAGWSVSPQTVGAQRSWVLRREQNNSSAITITHDSRNDLPLIEAFERLKAERGGITDCHGLGAAQAEPQRDPNAKAQLSAKHYDDRETYESLVKKLPVIGYRSTDDEMHCILVARDYVGGGVLYGEIIDHTGMLELNSAYVSEVVEATIGDINAREKSAPSSKQAACTGTEMYQDWVVSWSPKSSVVYVRNPEFLEADKSAGKKLRFGFTVGGKLVQGQGRQDPYVGLYIAAQENEEGFVPQKRAMHVDGTLVQEWGAGGGQWAALSDDAVQSLFAGERAVMETAELGRFAFPLKTLDTLLQLADLYQQRSVSQQALGMCSE